MAALRSSLESKERVRQQSVPASGEAGWADGDSPLQEGAQVGGSLAALQAEREALLRSARDRDAEVSSLKQQLQQQQGYQDLERDRLNRELEALRAQLQQQVSSPVREQRPFFDFSISVTEKRNAAVRNPLFWGGVPTLPQLNINAEQKLEIDRLKRELEVTRADLARANSSLQSREMVGASPLWPLVQQQNKKGQVRCLPAERHPAEQHAGGPAGGAGGAAALGEGAGGRAELPEAAGPAAAQLRRAGEAEEQHGAGEPARPAAAAGRGPAPPTAGPDG